MPKMCLCGVQKPFKWKKCKNQVYKTTGVTVFRTYENRRNCNFLYSVERQGVKNGKK